MSDTDRTRLSSYTHEYSPSNALLSSCVQSFRAAVQLTNPYVYKVRGVYQNVLILGEILVHNVGELVLEVRVL